MTKRNRTPVLVVVALAVLLAVGVAYTHPIWVSAGGIAVRSAFLTLQPAEAATPPTDSVDWTGVKQKWVPILSVEQQGLRVGAAQVAGPAAQVDRVKGVAELRLDFRGFARIYAYVPVATLTITKLDRVQGVSVWAVGDLELVGF